MTLRFHQPSAFKIHSPLMTDKQEFYGSIIEAHGLLAVVVV